MRNLVELSDSYRETKFETNGATNKIEQHIRDFINHRSESIIFLQIFLVREKGSEVIFYLSQVEWWNFTYTFLYQLLSPSLRKVIKQHTELSMYHFTIIVANLRCLEKCVTEKVCESLASYLWLTTFRVFSQRSEWGIMLVNRQKVRFIASIK